MPSSPQLARFANTGPSSVTYAHGRGLCGRGGRGGRRHAQAAAGAVRGSDRSRDVEGNGRQDIAADDRDRRYFVEAPVALVGWSGWEPIRFVLSNHSNLLVRTPRADLAGGMQRLL